MCGKCLNMTSCAGVNAAICISSVRESTSKRSAFDFTHCNILCRWRHLLLLGAVIHESHSPISPDWHPYTLLWITQPLRNRIIQNLLLKLPHIYLRHHLATLYSIHQTTLHIRTNRTDNNIVLRGQFHCPWLQQQHNRNNR